MRLAAIAFIWRGGVTLLSCFSVVFSASFGVMGILEFEVCHFNSNSTVDKLGKNERSVA